MKQKTKLRAGDLVIDRKLIKIRPVNIFYVGKYQQHYRQGVKMPPLIIEQGTNRVVSGNHRLTAILKEFGPEYLVEVIQHIYANEGEVLKEFARENAAHGKPLEGFDRRKLVHAALDEGVSAEELSKILGISISGLQRLCDGVVQVQIGGTDDETESMPKKRGFEPPDDKPLTKEIYEEHVNADRGLPLASQAGQLIRWLDADLIKPDAEKIQLLKELKTAIEAFLKRVESQLKKAS